MIGFNQPPTPANDNGPLGRIYTFEETAAELHVSRRSLQGIIKRHPFFAKNGKVYLFSEQDIQSIWEGMRCHCDSSKGKDLSTGISVAPSENSLYSKARALTTRRQPKQSASNARKVGTSVSSLSLVRYRLNDYSVPTAYGHRDVLVRGYVHEVVISCGAEVIARHPRSYEREDFVFDPLHYLALIEQKVNALDQAAPLAGWRLPEEFATLRRLLEARMGKQGKREFVQVLRLMEVFRADEVAAAVRDAIARGAIGFDAVKHLVLCRIERRPPRLDMTVYPYLPQAHVAMTSAKTYLGLLTGAAS